MQARELVASSPISTIDAVAYAYSDQLLARVVSKTVSIVLVHLFANQFLVLSSQPADYRS